MTIGLDSNWLVAALLITSRLSGIFIAGPVLGFSFLPVRIRIYVVLMLTWILMIGMGTNVPVVPQNTVALALAVGSEFLFGLVLGFGVQAAFAALSLAGYLVDTQSGLGTAVLFDPNTQSQSPLIATMMTMLGALIFMETNAHHELLRGLSFSLETVPLGHFGAMLDIPLLVGQFGAIFTYGFVIASPVILGLMLLDIATAVISRTMPQINIYFVILPFKIFLGLFIFALALTQLGPLLRTVFGISFQYWRSLGA